jgi:Methyltransferase domain
VRTLGQLTMMDTVKADTATQGNFLRANGMHYYSFLRGTHVKRRPKWYLEVGTCKGKSLTSVTCSSVAIDPSFKLQVPVHLDKPVLLMLQATSDDAFASDAYKNLSARFDIAFLDGMHRFEYLLRDIINAERSMAKDGVIFLHDTAPFNFEMTARKQISGSWTGDVWKLLPILAEYRPDLTVDHLDCKPTGLTMIRGNWGASDALQANYEKIVSQYMEMNINDYGVEKFYQQFGFSSAAAQLEKL